ncbi:pilus assembly PilX family protein [Desulfoplanes sp. PS50]
MNSEIVRNTEDGSVLVITLVILVLMMIIGMVASNTTTTELMIAANDREYRKDFYIADGALNIESEFVSTYPVVLTIAEQRDHQEYYIVKSSESGFSEDNSTDTTTQNATTHYVGSQEYKYAIKFIKRKQAIMKGEGARTVDILYNQIETKKSDSVSLMCQVYRRVTN